MTFTLNKIPGCYHLAASFHGRDDNDRGYQIQIFRNYSIDPVSVHYRHQIMHETSKKKHFDTIEQAMSFCKEFVTGEKEMPLHDNLVLYTWNIPIDSINTSITGTIVGSFNNMEDLKREAKQLLSSGKYDVLYAARPCGSIVLEAVLQEKENVTRTI